MYISFLRSEYNKMRNFTKQYINGEWVDSASGELLMLLTLQLKK